MPIKKIKIKNLLSFYKPYRLLLALDILCSALVAALSLLLPLCVRYITKDILETDSTNILAEVVPVAVLMLVIIVLRTCFAMFQDYKGHDMGAKIERDMRRQLFSHYQKLSHSFFDSKKTGDLMSRLTNDLLNLAELYHHGPENLVIYGSQFIGALIILLNINLKLTLIIFAFLPVMAVYSFIFYAKLQKSYAANRECIGDVNAFAEENLSGIRIVKSYANETVEVGKFAKENNKFYRSRKDIYKKEALHYTVIESFFTKLITVAIIVGGAVSISRDSLAMADLLMFILYVAYLIEPIPNLSFMVQQYQDGLSGYRRFQEIMDTLPDIQDKCDASDLQITDGCVDFDNVSFKYNKSDYVLRNISMNIQSGEVIAVVGVSGIGKTTLCSLIPRFYDATDGELRIDGVNIRDVTQDSLRKQIGVVSQDTFLFSGTILENILYGKPDAAIEEAEEAAKMADAHDFIVQLTNGYNTEIGERGVKLSGGQRQRISIARVFLKNPPILIFDEATSALDYESEKAVMKSLRLLAKGRTTFIIAHRLSTVQNADRIIVLSDGGIAEQGTHEQLIKTAGIYSNLYNSREL